MGDLTRLEDDHVVAVHDFLLLLVVPTTSTCEMVGVDKVPKSLFSFSPRSKRKALGALEWQDVTVGTQIGVRPNILHTLNIAGL